MPAAFLEIVELSNGDVGLRRSGETSLMVRLCFSEDSKQRMGEAKLEIARAMLEAGAEAYNEHLAANDVAAEVDDASSAGHVLH